MKKVINSSFVYRQTGQTVKYVYKEVDDVSEFGGKKVKGIHAYCFYKGKLAIVYADNKGYWTPAGGGVEEGETVEEAVIREVKEETNMKVLKHHLIGFMEVLEPKENAIQTRSVCIVEPYGPFVSDPDGDVTEIKLIDPKDYKKYFDWGEVGDMIMKRALELLKELEKK